MRHISGKFAGNKSAIDRRIGDVRRQKPRLSGFVSSAAYRSLEDNEFWVVAYDQSSHLFSKSTAFSSLHIDAVLAFSAKMATSTSPIASTGTNASTATPSVARRMLCVSDVRGDFAALDELARRERADAVICSGDFGFLDEASAERMSPRCVQVYEGWYFRARIDAVRLLLYRPVGFFAT